MFRLATGVLAISDEAPATETTEVVLPPHPEAGGFLVFGPVHAVRQPDVLVVSVVAEERDAVQPDVRVVRVLP